MSLDHWTVILLGGLLFGFWSLAKGLDRLHQEVRGLREQVAQLSRERK